MRVLVTGATGFVGSRVVEAFVRRGHVVRALVRPASKRLELPFGDGVEVRLMDLRSAQGLAAALEGMDAVVHLAAQVTGSDQARFAGTVVTTERLIAEMEIAGVRRLVLASSYAVYDWSRVGRSVDEDSALDEDLHERDGYAVAKLWQERVAVRAAERGGLDLTVLRPGYVWGPDELVPGVGPRVARVQLVFGPRACPPLTYVENCADCFVTATENQAAAGRVFNVVDADGLTTWRYARDHQHLSGDPALCVPVPYAFAYSVVRLVHAGARVVLGERMRLPSIFVPRRFEARFKPVHQGRGALERELGWRPPHPYAESLRRAFGATR